MAVQYTPFNNNNVVVPKLPTLPQYQPKQPTSKNNDPSAYYTKALGFLPIDVRYMANPTNGLAYNSMADVIFNHRAWRERWGHDSWLNTPLGYIPRLFADTFLLFKHQTLDPMVQGAIDDGWSGFLRGSSTAMMNGLVNLGNTLDIVSNPIKGLVLEGGDGFVKGLVGDHKGRKQYDYTDYIDTGSGVADFILSMGAEIVFDPLNWISWGSKAAIGTSAKTVANVAVDTISETVESVLKNTAKATIDDVAEALVKNTALNMDDAVAKTVAASLAKDVTDEATGVVTKQITKESVDEVLTGLSDRLTSALKRVGSQSTKHMDKTAQQLAESLVNGKTTRFKASLFKKAQPYTSAQQQIVASYLNNLDVSKLPTRFLTGNKIFNAVNNFERGLRYTAGATGLDLFIGGNTLRKYIGGRINNARALKEQAFIIKNISDFDEQLQFKMDDVVESTSEAVAKSEADLKLEAALKDKHTPIFEELSDYKDSTLQRMLNLKPEQFTVENLKTIHKEALEELNKKIHTLFPETRTLDEYILRLKHDIQPLNSKQLNSCVSQLESLKRMLTPDLDNAVVFKRYKDSITVFNERINYVLGSHVKLNIMPEDWARPGLYKQYYIKTERGYEPLAKWQPWKEDTFYRLRSQDDSMKEWRQLPKEIQTISDSISNYQKNVDDAIINIADEEEVWFIDKVVREAIDALSVNKKPTDLLEEYYNSFKAALEELTEAPDDIIIRRQVLYTYQDLTDYLRSLNKIPDVDLNTWRIAENKFGKKAVSVTKQSTQELYTLSEMIDELTEFNIKPIDKVIDVEKYVKYKLVTYSLINRHAYVFHDFLGISTTGKFLNTEVLEVELEHMVKDEAFLHPEFGTLLKTLHTYDSLNSVEYVSLNQIKKLEYCDILKKHASEFYNLCDTDNSAVFKTLINSDAKTIPDEYIDDVVEYYDQILARLNLADETFKVKNITELDPDLDFISRGEELLNKEIDNVYLGKGSIKILETFITIREQAKALMAASNETIDTLFNTTSKATSVKGAALGRLLNTYADETSPLYKALNPVDPSVYTASEMTIVNSVKDLIIRSQQYKTLLNQLMSTLDAYGLTDLYKEGFIDSLTTMFSKNINVNYIDELTTELLSRTELFINNRTSVSLTNMDDVLSKTVTALSKTSNLPPEADSLVKNITFNLNKGLAHGATIDVDNWISLTQLSKYTDDKQVSDLLYTAKGRYIVAFDIETTGAKEASAIPFQISGKILNPDGTVVSGSEFNYIIKPPKGVKPLPSVLEKLAPAGVDPNKWWLDNIVNAKTIEGQQVVFENVKDAIGAFVNECNKYSDSGFILAGQNIKNFDIDMLSKRGNKKAAEFFNKLNKNTDVFDSLDFFSRTAKLSFPDEVKQQLTRNIKSIFQDYVDADSLIFKQKLFTFDDVRNLSSFKTLYHDKPLISSLEDGFGLEDELGVEAAISEIITTWRTPPKLKYKNYITVSQLNPNALQDATKKLLTELEDQGLINVKPGCSIMQYLNSGVATGSILLNPKRVLSYEVFDIFDQQKCLKHFTKFNDNSISFNTMYRLTEMMYGIKNIRTYTTDDVVKEVLSTAESFLKTIKEYRGTHSINAFVNSLYDDADDLTKVSCAVYFYNKIKDSAFIKEHPKFKTLGDLRAIKRRLNGNVDFKPTALGYSSSKTNPITGQPQWIYEDYSWAELAKTNKNNPLGDIRKFNTHHHLYNIDEAARFKLCTEDFEFAQRFEDCLNKVTEGRSELELRIKHYNDVLDRAEIDEVLTRSNRVTAFKAEAKLRAGHFYFETTDEIDLSDFSAAEDLIVISNKLTDRDTYAHFIGVKREFFDTTAEVTLPVRMVKTSTLSKDVFDLITEGRQRMGRVMKNIGYSRGDELTAETIDNIHDTLRRLGVDDNTLALLPDGDYLKASEYFDTLRVNHSVVGNQQMWQFVMDDPDVFRTSDPIKQLLYNTKAVVGKRLDSLTGYANLICNEWNCINTKGGLFDKLSNVDLYELLKNNSDFGIYYIKKAGKLDKTSTGCVVKELQLVNKNTIDVAKKINAYILPRTHARQLMGAFNKFELPPVAKFFKDISDVYKVAYLGSIGFLIRNFIDSNYKTYVGLNGEISLPTQLKQFFSSIKLIKRHTDIGREYTARMGKDFKNDLEYDVFNKYCHRYTEDNVAEKIASEYGEKHHNKIVKYVNELSEKFTDTAVLQSLQKQLLDTNMFSIMNVFIKSGPSTGMSKSVLDNIISSNKTKDLNALQKFNKFMTEDTPLKYVYGINDYIEQAARLSMFLTDLERGSGIDEAIRNIVKTHFDYSDKSLGMLYTEIVFPFMSFSYKNMEFWIEYMYRNPMFVGQLENIFRPIMNYHSVFEPNQEAYESFDYKFDWSKDVWSFQARAPWTTINAARLYHLLAGNIVIDSGKDVKHNAGYGYKDNDLFYVFKLSPSVLDAVKMLYNPLSSYSERMLPPYEALLNGMVGALNGTIDSTEINTTSLMNILPYTDVIAQRVGLQGNFGLKHNNIGQRISDGGPLMAIGSTFGLAYAPKKTNNYWYDSDYNILGGFKTNYYAKRIYANPYDSVVPRYTIRRMSQNKKPRAIYTPTKKTRVKKQIIPTQVARYSDNILKLRIKDYKYYL